MDVESGILPYEFGRRVNGGVDRINQLPDEILFVILSFLRLKEAAATTVLSSRWLDLWKHIPSLKFDRISLLPNQITAVILSFLSLREAAATSVLSSRWSDLWKHTPNLNLDMRIIRDYNPDNDDDDDDILWDAHICKYIETVNCVIQAHKALSLKKFRISNVFKKSNKFAVTKWFEFVFSKQVESLELNLPCLEFDQFVLGELLRESRICLQPQTDLIFFQSLKRLCLGCLNVSGEDIELFLRNCPLLEILMIYGVTLTSDVEVCGAKLLLKDLDIFGHTSEKSIKVFAPNLTRIGFSDSAGTLSFDNVPKLVEAVFKLKGSLFAIQHFASAASCYLSQLQRLDLVLLNFKVFWMSGFPAAMPNLKKLDILIYEAYSHSLLPLTALIWASPRLEDIKIKFTGIIKDTSAWMGAITNVERSPHHHLKVFAFQMATCQYVGVSDHIIELVTYILDNCVAFQKIIIGSPLYDVRANRITAEMLAYADDLTQQLQAKVPNHIQLELPYSILQSNKRF